MCLAHCCHQTWLCSDVRLANLFDTALWDVIQSSNWIATHLTLFATFITSLMLTLSYTACNAALQDRIQSVKV